MRYARKIFLCLLLVIALSFAAHADTTWDADQTATTQTIDGDVSVTNDITLTIP